MGTRIKNLAEIKLCSQKRSHQKIGVNPTISLSNPENPIYRELNIFLPHIYRNVGYRQLKQYVKPFLGVTTGLTTGKKHGVAMKRADGNTWKTKVTEGCQREKFSLHLGG